MRTSLFFDENSPNHQTRSIVQEFVEQHQIRCMSCGAPAEDNFGQSNSPDQLDLFETIGSTSDEQNSANSNVVQITNRFSV